MTKRLGRKRCGENYEGGFREVLRAKLREVCLVIARTLSAVRQRDIWGVFVQHASAACEVYCNLGVEFPMVAKRARVDRGKARRQGEGGGAGRGESKYIQCRRMRPASHTVDKEKKKKGKGAGREDGPMSRT